MAFNIGKFAGNAIQGYQNTTLAQQQIAQQQYQNMLKEKLGQYVKQMVDPAQQAAPAQSQSSPQGLGAVFNRLIGGQSNNTPAPVAPQMGGVSPPVQGAAPASGAPGGAGSTAFAGGAPTQMNASSMPQSPISAAFNDPINKQMATAAWQASGGNPALAGDLFLQMQQMYKAPAANITRIENVDAQQAGANQRNQNTNDTHIVTTGMQQTGANQRNDKTNTTRKYGIDTQANTAAKKLDAYSTKWSMDRDEKAREAAQRSQDVNKSIDERAQAAADAARYRAASLQEKAREADQRSVNMQLSEMDRQQAREDAMQLKRQYYKEKEQMDVAKQKDMLAKQQQAAINEQGRNNRAAAKQSAKTNSMVGQPAAGGEVAVISPDGQLGTIPADQLEDALKSGYKKQ